MAKRIVIHIERHRAGQGIGHYQRRGGQEIHPDLGMDAALEIAIAGQYRGDRQFAVMDGLADGFGQGTGVADAGGAAIAHQVEAQLLPAPATDPACLRYSVTTREPGASEVLTQGFTRRPAGHGLLGQQAGAP